MNYSLLGSKLLFHHENQARPLNAHVDLDLLHVWGAESENTTSVFPTSATDGSL